jgi:hypothetical protein
MLLFLCKMMPHWCRCTADVLIIGWVQLWDVKYLQEGDDEASEGVDTKQQASLGENTGSQGNGQTDSTIISEDDSDDEMEAEGMSMSRIFAAFSAKTASGGLVLVHLLCKTGT